MKSFDVGERVVFQHDGVRGRGRVTQCLPKKRRIVSDTGRRLTLPLASLTKSKDSVLILEGRLNPNLRSRREYGPAIKQLLSAAYPFEVLHEKVHTREDLRRFIQKDGRSVHNRIIHIICHGGASRPGSACLHLTFDEVELMAHLDIFAGLEGKILIFSCCEVGKDQHTLQAIKAASGAAVIVAYRKSVLDPYTVLAELLLYELVLNGGKKPESAVTAVAASLYDLGVQACDGQIKKPVMVYA